MPTFTKITLLLLFAPAFCFSATAFPPSNHANNNDLTIHFIDVGHGDATFINCPNGKMILIDAGSSSGFPGGKLRYYLLKHGKLAGKVLDTLVLTRPDQSNYNLITRALDKVPVSRIYLTGSEDNYREGRFKKWIKNIDPARKVFLDADDFDKEDVPNPEISCGDADVYILAVSADEEKLARIVLMIRYGEFEAILAGGATTATKEAIMNRYTKEWLASDLLKISSPVDLELPAGLHWVETVQPKVVVLSRSDNKFTGNSEQQYFEGIYSTTTTGNLVVTSNGSGFKIDAVTQNQR